MPLTLTYQDKPRHDLLAVMAAALEAVRPDIALQRILQRDGTSLRVAGRRYDLAAFDHVWLVGAGKGSAPMVHAAEAILGEALSGGIIVVKQGHRLPLQRVQQREAAHPVPNQAGLAAGAEILNLAQRATERDLLLCLLSGGGSALLEALPDLLDLVALQATTEALLASGATIHEVNAVRKHLSQIKGGQLARAAAPATLVTLVLSDVVGSPLDVIASGPTVGDRSTWADVAEIVERYELASRLPTTVLAYLRRGIAGALPDTPQPDDPLFANNAVHLIGDNALAAGAAQRAATDLGYQALVLSTFVEGEARHVADWLVALGREVLAHGRPVPRPACLILGGETTVTLTEGDSPHPPPSPHPLPTSGEGGGAERSHDQVIRSGHTGIGGRNQELALAAALRLADHDGIVVGALATDGSDGPTDSAGAIVDSGTVARAARRGLDAAAHLRQHNAYPLIDASGDLLRSGPTLTNVNDLLFVVVE